MKKQLSAYDFDTLVEALQFLEEKGYDHEFSAEQKGIRDKDTGKLYAPREVIVKGKYRFEGESDPSDSMEVLAIRTDEGIKGTIVLSYGAKHSQNAEMIRMI